MKKLNAVLVIAVSSAALAVGMVAGTALAADTRDLDVDLKSVTLVEKFDVNARGETIGLAGQTLQGNPTAIPDMILVIADNGVEGYVYYDEVFGAAPQRGETPKELGDKPFTVNVYSVDGDVVGSFTANSGASTR